MIAPPLIGRNGGRWECVDCDTWARHGVDVGEADDTLFTQLAKQVLILADSKFLSHFVGCTLCVSNVFPLHSALVANNSLDV